ncbi:hypothetical protein HYU09_01285 [Candidatus Woesearchaeota archaeon]|nr:hypothetical protein [Candidatus Woesearchaeota archaeon]
MKLRNVIGITAAVIVSLAFLVILSYIFVKITNPPLVDPEIERIIVRDMVENNKRISVPAKLDMNMGEAKAVYVGLRNDKNNVLNYRLEFDIFAEAGNRSYKSVLKYQGVAKSLEEGSTEVGKVDISIPQSDFSKGNYLLKVSIIDEDLNGIYASDDILLAIK